MTRIIILASLVLATTSFTAADNQKPKLQPTDAEKIALSTAPGKVENQDTLTDPVRYSFDVQTSKEIRVVVVDGNSGKVLSNSTETPDDLAAKKKKKSSVVVKGNSKLQGNVAVK
jgi:hypothetical protein